MITSHFLIIIIAVFSFLAFVLILFFPLLCRKTFFFEIFCKKNVIYALIFRFLLSLCIINLNNENIMKELIEKIQETYAAFAVDATAQAEKGNKAAGTRARKASLELEKAMKAFRKASLEAAK